MTIEAGAGEGAKFARTIGGSSSIGPETTPAGEGAGGHEVGVRRSCAQTRHGVGDIWGRHPLRHQPGTDRPQGITAAMQRLHPPSSVGDIVEQARLSVARDKRIDQR